MVVAVGPAVAWFLISVAVFNSVSERSRWIQAAAYFALVAASSLFSFVICYMATAYLLGVRKDLWAGLIPFGI